MANDTANHEAQLEWERRAALPVAVLAMVAALLMIQPLFVRAALYENRKGFEDTPRFLLSLHEHTTGFLLSAIGEAIGVLALGAVFFYLFRATRYRSPELPEFFKYLIVIGPVLFAISSVLGVIDPAHIADKFANGVPIRGSEGGDRAEDLLKDISPFTVALQIAGRIAVAFLYVMLSLRAMRAGLLSRFMGVVGVLVGALVVIQIIPQPLIQLLWLPAFAALVLDRWPNGRGPAWETGENTPWPPPAPRGGALAAGDENLAQPEPVPERPASRKRKRKRG
jgi:uncharacterized membrane protein